MGYRYFPWMLALAGLFFLRVLAQLVQALHPVAFLPPFEAWHGAVLPYPLLVVSQILILILLLAIIWRVRHDRIEPKPWKYLGCYLFGGLYFALMAFRLFAGLTFLAAHPWFAKSLPAFFHLVLASFLLLLGFYLQQSLAGSRLDVLAKAGK